MLVVDTPTTVRIDASLRKQVEPLLAYSNTSAVFQLRRHSKSSAWRGRDPEYLAQEQALREQAEGSLLFEDSQGLWTYSGLAAYLQHALRAKLTYLAPRSAAPPLRWRRPPPPLRPYQVDALEAIMAAPPGPVSVEMGTGLGKSLLIYNFVVRVGGRALVVAPTGNIARQLLEGLQTYLGEREVGPFFDGDKMPGKRVVVGTYQSLARVVADSDVGRLLGDRRALVVDESHMTPAKTLRTTCMGFAKDIPWRLFTSGTQTRGDGQELVLRGLVGDPVYSMTVRQGVDGGHLARPNFGMLRVRSELPYDGRQDTLTQERLHLYRNEAALRGPAALAEELLGAGWRVLTLVREVETAVKLSGLLKHPWELARGSEDRDCLCGGKPRKVRCELCDGSGRIKVLAAKPQTDPTELVARFNAGEIQHLVGTSCIGVGTDIHPPGPMAVFWLAGGASEIDFPQGVGRGTRRQGKDEFWFWDVDVRNIPELHERANRRRQLMAAIYAPPTEVDL